MDYQCSVAGNDFKGIEYPVVFYDNGGIGDHIIHLPTLRALAALFPHKLMLICQPGAKKKYYRNLPLRSVFEQQLLSDDNSTEFDAIKTSTVIKQCDLFIWLNTWFSPSVNQVIKLLSPSITIGFFRKFDIYLKIDPNKHCMDQPFTIPLFFNNSLKLEDFMYPMAFGSKSLILIEKIRKLIKPSNKIIALHTDTKFEKMWPINRFIDLLDLFLSQHPDYWVLVVGNPDKAIEKIFHISRVINCTGLPITTSFSLVAHSDLFLGIDSCMLHIADLSLVPSVGLFGPTNFQEWGFRIAPHRHVVSQDGSMKGISVGMVLNKLEEIIFSR